MKRKVEENSDNIISEYIKENKEMACELLDAIMKELKNPERLRDAPLNQLSSVMGTVIDKFGSREKDENDGNGTLSTIFDDFKDIK